MVAITAYLTSFVLCVACAALPTTIDTRLASQAPLPPSQDPFYTAPAGFENTEPGTILRVRLAPGNLTTTTPNCSSVHNILYRTTDSRYQPSWAVTTLFTPLLPSHLNNSLLSYQIPYNSADVDSSPSYSLYNTTEVPADIPEALGRGWYVNVPDFEGPPASFILGVQEGHATLDSVRAVLRSDLIPDKGTSVAMWGYSGGSLASEWAAELQVQYAPELNFAGVALGGLVTNVTAVFDTISGTMWAGLIPSGILGMTSQYPDAYELMLSKLKKTGRYNATMFLAAKNMTFLEAFAAFSGQDIFDYFEDGVEFYNSPIIQKLVETNGFMGYHGVPQMPLFIYKAVQDELTPINGTDELVKRYCDVGANILYQRNTIGGHLAEETNGDARAFEWLSNVLEEKAHTSETGCLVEDVAINITSSPL